MIAYCKDWTHQLRTSVNDQFYSLNIQLNSIEFLHVTQLYYYKFNNYLLLTKHLNLIVYLKGHSLDGIGCNRG